MKIFKPEHIFLYGIKKKCVEYLNHQITLDFLQAFVEHHFDNWGNEVPKEIRSIIGDFIRNIEVDRYMYDEPKKSIIIQQTINNLLNYVNSIVPSNIDELDTE